MTSPSNLSSARRDGPQREPTMREVATLAGVSIKTVSRVINQEAGVAPETVAKVHQAVTLLGYQHNLHASNLRRLDQRTATIGLLLDDVSNPFLSVLHRAVEDAARRRGSMVFAVSSDALAEREDQIILELTSRRIDGLIVVSSSQNRASLLQFQRVGRPVVFVDRIATLPNCDSVTVDNRAATMRGVQHLMAHGHQRIAFLGDMNWIWTANERHLGYLDAMAQSHLRLDPQLVRMDLNTDLVAEQAVVEMMALAEPPTAIFAAQNLITIGSVRALQRLGLHHRIALVGFDEFVLADLLDPPVTVVAQDPAALGQAAAEQLFARLGGDRSPTGHHVVPTRLIIRGSGEIAPG